MRFTLFLVGALFIIYGFASLRMNRLNTGLLAFLTIGTVFLLAAKYLTSVEEYLHRRKKLKKTLSLILLIGVILTLTLEGCILWGMREEHPKNVESIVVLGAGVKKGLPTPVLRSRLQKAIKVHKEYPMAKIYVTGGLDTGESKTEAFVMKDFLVANGIDTNMIIMEDAATSTEENFKFTKKLMSNEHPKIMVVTSDFHLFRSKHYAKMTGFEPYSAGARIPLSIIPLTHIREILAIGFMFAKEGFQSLYEWKS